MKTLKAFVRFELLSGDGGRDSETLGSSALVGEFEIGDEVLPEDLASAVEVGMGKFLADSTELAPGEARKVAEGKFAD